MKRILLSVVCVFLFQMMIAQVGKVGINTTSPQAGLHVADSNVLFSGPVVLPNPSPPPPVSGAGTRLMWYPGKGSFRAGRILGTQWDKDSIGLNSIGLGFNVIASGERSISIGAYCRAGEFASVAIGYGNEATGYYSSAFGNTGKAKGESSTVLGQFNTSIGAVSLATGGSTQSVGNYSASFGEHTIARPTHSLVLGRFNDTTSLSTEIWNDTDALFILGNGTSHNTRQNAVTILKNARTGINTHDPKAMLHVHQGDLLVTGPNPLPASSQDPPITGAGNRMMWYADKAAFRVGQINGTHWDRDSIGKFSFACGLDTKAKSVQSFAGGFNSVSSGSTSLAYGYEAKAQEFTSVALNYFTKANGYYSTALGAFTEAIGQGSIAAGQFSKARSFMQVVIGQFNDTTSLASAVWNANDPVFVIGNGVSNANRTNALTVLKNAKTGINTHDPKAMLHIEQGSLLAIGPNNTNSSIPPPVSGPGNRLMWYPERAAFRAGGINSTYWDQDSIGSWSVAIGLNVKATGQSSAAFGHNCEAKGLTSFTSGHLNKATGLASTAIGSVNLASGISSFSSGTSSTASGNNSFAIGENSDAAGNNSFSGGANSDALGTGSFVFGHDCIATGNYSFASGFQIESQSYACHTLGRHNILTTPSASTWVGTDPVFVIGNGASPGSRSNALTVLKNGNMGLGPDFTPDFRLHVTNNNSQDGGWAEGIVVENISPGANVGEAAIAFKNDALAPVKYWMVGLNQNPQLAFNYGSSLAGVNTRMVLDTLGNLGVGTTAPGHKLHVNGDAGKPGGGSWTAASDLRLKEQVIPYTDGLERVMHINPVRYHYNAESGYDTTPEYIGVIAQELENIAPYMVRPIDNPDGDESGSLPEYLTVDNSAMVYMLINAVKEQQGMISLLQEKIIELEKKIAEAER